MTTPPDKIRALIIFFGLSVLAHLLVLFSLRGFGNYSFAAPVNPLKAVMVDLTKPSVDTAPVAGSDNQEINHTDKVVEDTTDDGNHAPVHGEVISGPPAVPEKSLIDAELVEPAVHGREKADAFTLSSVPTKNPLAAASREVSIATAISPPLRTADEFLKTTSEKLSYQISMFGLPVGSAELEAKNEHGDIRITLRVKSNTVLSSIYPVNDSVETRHIGGNFIITRIRQQEGGFRSDRGFTIFLRDKRVFWIDRLRNLSAKESIPNENVVDIISGCYYLRNQPLQVGATKMLHIYDSNTYALLPVEVLRREQVMLPGFRKADTIVIKPLLKTDGIFKRTGDVFIWLTDDENKVPVKVETRIPLGKVTAELVSAETERHDEPSASDTARRKTDQ